MKLSHLVTAATLSLNYATHSAPLFRIFELTIDSSQKDRFDSVGFHNLNTSVKTEPGTLAMYSTQIKDQPSKSIILEIYQDQDAYQKHVASYQFGQYVKMAKDVVKDRKIFETDAQFLAEKSQPLTTVSNTDLLINYVEVQVKPSSREQFSQIVLKEMQQAMNEEPGILVMYAVTLKNQPEHWRFFEIYKDSDAYDQHRNFHYFKEYLEKTKSMVINKKLIQLQADTLMNKGGLYFYDKARPGTE